MLPLGGGFVFTEEEADKSVEIFRERLSKYYLEDEEDRFDVRYYLAQSWHYLNEKDFRLAVRVSIDKELDCEWHK